MEWINETLFAADKAALLSLSGGGIAAILLYLSHTIRKWVFRIFFIAALTLGGVFAGGTYLGYEITPKDNVSKVQLERQKMLRNWQEKIVSFFKKHKEGDET